jgi:hypothetical protein
MTREDERDRFRSLPHPLRPEDLVEMVDTTDNPVPDGSEDRDRLLREAGGI